MTTSDPQRVLCVRPPGRFMSATFPDGPMVGPPRALLYLAASVRGEEAVTVRILDALAHPDVAALADAPRPFLFGLTPEQVADEARAWRADVVAVSTMAAYYRRETVDLIHAVRAALPDAFIVLGGADPTVDAAVYLDAAPVDAVCIGEGERTFPALLARLRAGSDWRAVAGLAWRDGDGVAQSPSQAPVDDLDALVPDFSLVDLHRYFDLARQGWRARPTFQRPGVARSVDVITSRGCPYRCSFCVIHTTMGRRFRVRSVGSVVAQLTALVRDHGVTHVHFEDDVINLDRRRFRALLRALIAADLPLTWDTPNGLRADLLDAELVRLCREAGCVYLIFGVESGSQRVLDEVVDKELRLSHVVDAARWCRAATLDCMAFFIVGMPGETAEEAEETLTFALNLLRDAGTTPVLQVWRPYVQTDLFDQAGPMRALTIAERVGLHEHTGIPFSQFHSQAAARGDGLTAALADLYARYGRALAAGQLARWRQAGVRAPLASDEPADVQRFLMSTAPFLHAHCRSLRSQGSDD